MRAAPWVPPPPPLSGLQRGGGGGRCRGATAPLGRSSRPALPQVAPLPSPWPRDSPAWRDPSRPAAGGGGRPAAWRCSCRSSPILARLRRRRRPGLWGRPEISREPPPPLSRVLLPAGGEGWGRGGGAEGGGGARLGLGAGPDRVSGRSMGCSYPYLGQGRPSVGHGYGKIHMERRPKVGQGLWGTDPGRAGRPGSARAGPNLGGPPWPHPAALQAGVPQAQAGLLSALCHSCHTAFWDY